MDNHILKALIHRATRNRKTPEATRSLTTPLLAVRTPISGKDIAIKFAAQVANVLDKEEVFELVRFLNRQTEPLQTNELQEQLRQLLENFYTAEQAESGLDHTGLAIPAGPVDAEFGLILHMQSREESTTNPFWDMSNTTIRLLHMKGLSGQFSFSFDWHWRSARLVRGRSHCVTTGWEKSVRNLHDMLSSDILDLIPLPFLVVAGACARDGVEKAHKGCSKRITIPLLPQCDLIFDLVFHERTCKRIIGYVDHPSAWFFAPTLFDVFSSRLDAIFNFFLWLLGKEHNQASFSRAFAAHREGISFSSNMLRGRACSNKQLRSRLLGGDVFKCTKMKNRTELGRIYFRGVHLLVPADADFDSVVVRCHLAPDGQKHITPCTVTTHETDPANRLGIQLLYTSKKTGSTTSTWCKHSGEASAKKLNSLVDFLEGKSEGYTEGQPRRFLDRNKGRGRSHISYSF